LVLVGWLIDWVRRAACWVAPHIFKKYICMSPERHRDTWTESLGRYIQVWTETQRRERTRENERKRERERERERTRERERNKIKEKKRKEKKKEEKKKKKRTKKKRKIFFSKKNFLKI
jgi:hypothetical protein